MSWHWPWTMQEAIERLEARVSHLESVLAATRDDMRRDTTQLQTATVSLKRAIQAAASSSDTLIK